MGSCFGPYFGECHQGPITSIGPASFNPVSWAWESGPARLFFKPNQLPLSPWLRRVWARAASLLRSGAISTWLLGLISFIALFIVLPICLVSGLLRLLN